MPEVHALLSASSSKQWLNCPPSARLQEGFPNESSSYAEEGTFAHSVCEYKVKKYLHERVSRPQSEEWYTEEIDQITDVYAEFVITIIEQMKRNGCEPLVLVEERVNYSHIAPSGFGTADMLIVGKDENGKGLLHICDFKAGQGVYVEADHNSQMMLYALGGLAAYGYIYEIETVRMTIIQPRLENISTFESTREELEAWGESIRETAKMAYEGKGVQKAGDWCRFCRAKPVCRACAEEALALAREEFLDLDAGAFSDEVNPYTPIQLSDSPASSDEVGAADAAGGDAVEETDATAPYNADRSAPVFQQPGLVPFSELVEIMPTLNRISSYKVVEGRSKRIFTDTKAVVKTAMDNGYTDLYKQQLISLTEFEKMMGKKRFAELLSDYVVKPPGKLALVPESDPRPPVELDYTPDQEFSVLPDDEE